MGRATRVVTMWTGHHQVRISLYGDADADADLATRLETIVSQLLQAGATHVVVHLERLTGDDAAVVDVLARSCQRLWLRRGVMEIGGGRVPSRTPAAVTRGPVTTRSSDRARGPRVP
jgi:hypothetical protein